MHLLGPGCVHVAACGGGWDDCAGFSQVSSASALLVRSSQHIMATTEVVIAPQHASIALRATVMALGSNTCAPVQEVAV